MAKAVKANRGSGKKLVLVARPKATAHGVAHATDADFARLVAASTLPVLVDFWAEWCGPCRAIAPVIEKIAVKYAGRLTVVKVDVDAAPRTANRWKIAAIPTLYLIVGKKKHECRGALDQRALEAWIARETGLAP